MSITQEQKGKILMPEDNVDKKTLSRRSFLKLAVAAQAAPFLPRIPQGVPHAEVQQPPEPTVIEGIRVFGHENSIQNEETFRTIIAKEEEEALPGVENMYERLSRNELIAWRKTVLPKNKRYMDVLVAESVYKRFSQIEGVGNFATWYKRYIVDRMNAITKSGIPDLDLEVLLKRVFVIRDSLMDGYQVRLDPGKDKWHKDRFGRLPLDIDLRWGVGSGYLDLIKDDDSGIDGAIIVDGKNVPKDTGLIHEHLHGFFHLPDWYRQNASILGPGMPRYLDGISAYPSDIMSGRVENISPLTAVHIRSTVKRFGFRSVESDVLPDRFVDKEFPPQGAVIKFVHKEGTVTPVIGRVLASVSPKDRTFEGQHAGEIYEVSEPLEGIIEDAKDTLPLKRGDLDRGFPYLLAEISFPNRDDFPQLTLPIPRSLFRLAAWEEDPQPNFTIYFTDEIYSLGEQLELETVWKEDLEKYYWENLKTRRVFAYSDIFDTGAVHIWSWRDSSSIPLAVPIVAGIGGAIAANVAADKIGKFIAGLGKG